MSDMQRSADRRRWSVDREDIAARAAAVESIDAVRLPARQPLLLEPFEGGFIRDGHGVIEIKGN
jgi:hypothetical protein